MRRRAGNEEDMSPTDVMQRVLREIATNATAIELRVNAYGHLNLHMLAAKLVDKSVGVLHSNKWQMDREGNITVIFKPRDHFRYGMNSCTVSQHEFEKMLVTIFARKIAVPNFNARDWQNFALRLKGTRAFKAAQSNFNTQPLARKSAVGSSLSHF